MQLAKSLVIIALKIKTKIARRVIHLREIGNIEVPRTLGEKMGYTFKITDLSRVPVYYIKKGSYCRVHGISLLWEKLIFDYIFKSYFILNYLCVGLCTCNTKAKGI